MIPSALFFLKIVLAIQVFCYYTNLEFFFFTSVKKCHWYFERDCIESVDSPGEHSHS